MKVWAEVEGRVKIEVKVRVKIEARVKIKARVRPTNAMTFVSCCMCPSLVRQIPLSKKPTSEINLDIS